MDMPLKEGFYVVKDSPLEKFLEETKCKTPEERGAALETNEVPSIQSTSNISTFKSELIKSIVISGY